jgi:2-polyprenyl-3-methyl-5-hydroxy-6-metoxy-1,4-benzoquinol methylase
MPAQTRTRPTTPEGPWPSADLEPVNACPVCSSLERKIMHDGLTDRTFFCAPGLWTLQHCKACDSAYQDPRPTRESIHRAYSSYYTHGDQPQWDDRYGPTVYNRLRAWRDDFLRSRYGYPSQPNLSSGSSFGANIVTLVPWLRYRAELHIRHLPHPNGSGLNSAARLLDVGCGSGTFLQVIKALGWQTVGLEPDPKACEFARSVGLEVHTGSLQDTTLEPASFDAITLNHVIEHLHDPKSDLEVCLRLLRPGGTLWITTPNLGAIGHRRYGKDWLHLDPPRHLVLFTLKSLEGLIQRAGFELLPRPQPPILATDLFMLSQAIMQGRGSWEMNGLSVRDAFDSVIADLQSLRQPENAEENTVIARKPL